MPKIEVSTVAEVGKKIQMEPKQLRELIEAINSLLEPEEEKPPAIKKQFVILISDPTGVIGLLLKDDFAGWVLQIPENESVATTQDRILRTAYDFNASRKGRLHPVNTIGEAIENIPSRMFKENDVWVKTKTPVIMLRTDGDIPDGKKEGV